MADDFTPPGRSEDYPSKPQGYDRLLGELRDIRTRLSDLPHGLLRAAGISVTPEGMTIGSALTITGDTRIEGTLSLPAGIIDNEALANPIAHRSTWDSVSNFALPNAWTDYVSVSLTVPPGFTRMQFNAIGVVEGRNDTGSTQYLLTRIWRGVNGAEPTFGSVQTRETVPDLYWATGFVPYMWGETVTPGDVHTLVLRAWAGGATWTADASHRARLEVTATFSRS